MKELAHHLCLGLVDRRVLACTREQRVQIARAVLRVGRPHRLLVFRAADTHLHLESLCDRRSAGRLARRVEMSLHKVIGYPVGFEPARIWPITSQRHLSNTARYILRQNERHQLEIDPWGEASNLPDLLGLRLIGGYTAQELGGALPRLSAGELATIIGCDLEQLIAGDHWLDVVDQLAGAAASAAALPHLTGRASETVAARRAAAAATRGALDASQLADVLDVSTRTARRLRAEAGSPPLVQAIRRQLRLRASYARLRPPSESRVLEPSER